MYQEEVDIFAGRLKDPSIPSLSTNEWEFVSLIEHWLHIFRAATAVTSSTSTPTLSCVHGVYKGLQDALMLQLGILPGDSPSFLKEALKRAFEKLGNYYYWTDESPYYVWAASMSFSSSISSFSDISLVLDPRIRYKGLLDDNLDDPDGTSANDHVVHCKNLLESHFHQKYLPPTPPAPRVDPGMNSTSNPPLRTFFDFTARYTTQHKPAEPSDELEMYLKTWITTEELKDGPLCWWKRNHVRFPNLAKLAREVLAIPCKFSDLPSRSASYHFTCRLRLLTLTTQVLRLPWRGFSQVVATLSRFVVQVSVLIQSASSCYFDKRFCGRALRHRSDCIYHI